MISEFDLNSWLQKTLVFQGLPRSHLIPVVQIAQLRSLTKGEVLFKQGSDATGFFIVKSGRIKVFKVSSNGKEQILHIFEAGENFAEVAALDGKPFPASAAALEPTELFFFPRSAFLDLLHQYPEIAINMLISLSQHLRQLASIIEELSFKDVPQRLATYLLNLVPSNPDPANLLVTLDLTKSQLAAILGTIPATLSRSFYYLSSEGMISVNGARIEILDYDRLQALSQTLN